jgi:uncharacterized membrane protein YfcA
MDPALFAFAAFAVFCGAFVRGYAGFGSGLIWASSLSLVLPPIVVVPSIYLLDLIASAHLVPRVWKDIDWRSLRWLLLGAFIATPAGLYLLASLPERPIRAAIAVVVLTATALLWRGFAWKAVPGPRPATLVGLLSGFIGGGTGVGGPPAILFYFSSPTTVGVSRASLIGYLFGLDIVSVGMAGAQGFYTREVGLWVAVLALPVLAGIVLGNRRFIKADPERFRRYVLLLLAALSIAVFLRAVLG